MRYVAGLDGGGTKTAVTVADERGRPIHTFVSGAINYNGQDEESIRLSFQTIMAEIAKACGGLAHCAQICIGAAGVSNPAVQERLTANVRDCGYEGGLLITGDHETALCGALDSPVGMILIAGTGSICFGRNDGGSTHRTGGCGYLIDDEGSGYSIGRDLLSAVAKAGDGRIQPTVITELVYARLGMSSVRELIGFAHDKHTNKKDIAALAPLLTEACDSGDSAAQAIVKRSAASLLELVVPVAEKLAMQDGRLVLAGSVLLKNAYVRDAFETLLKREYPSMPCVAAPDDASGGAVRMALLELA
ncbi:N-acetylglucosamine kinase [Paenibacillus sacheonensis]|uniref:ATPase n=1 Tax=Paenibacillus sacheonensis TaxID=742054 RepID=A0A7X4YRY3_9BACL|nr:BadF/BadG/BcrA/BcrD ATPase family protein [Paenibacillus sacheonensis]MBM7566835.1 N-acetylglucosamine kinase-like BadF-type ATPase [Paenibacillus sacheonensis]NBC71457.1 ATPase [Paenibacillus sacheonensis]